MVRCQRTLRATRSTYTYFDLGDLYKDNPALSEEANKQFVINQMNRGKPFYIQLPNDIPVGKGLDTELDMLNKNPNYSGSLEDRFFGWVWW